MKKLLPIIFLFSCSRPYYAPIISDKPNIKKVTIHDTIRINCDTINEGIHIKFLKQLKDD